MPSARMGDKISLDRKEFLELKSKGEKVLIRFASSNYYYEGKHFTQQKNGEWDVAMCPRVNNEVECENCNQYFEIRKQIKQAKADKDAEAEKSLDKLSRKVKPNIAFYYPVLDRESHTAAIFRTSLMIRLALEEKVNEGVDILNVDFTVKRTEKAGSYYSLERVDSSETPKLTKEEKAELELAKETNVGEVVGGKKGSMSFDVEVEPGEKVNADDIPF